MRAKTIEERQGSGAFFRMGSKPGVDERADQPGPNRALMIGGIARTEVADHPLPFALPDGVDFILYRDVLEHLPDPWALLRAQAELLNEDGTLLLCLPNDDHWRHAERALRGLAVICPEDTTEAHLDENPTERKTNPGSYQVPLLPGSTQYYR